MKKEVVKEEKDIYELLEHYKCTICKEEFYLLKDEKDKDDEIFKDEEYAHLPIFLKDNSKKITCPYCKASKRSLLYIETEKEKKSKLEKMKEELEKIKEEEKRLDDLRKDQIEELCKEIETDVLNEVKVLIDDIKSSKYNVDNLLKQFRKISFNIIDRNTKIFNRRNKEVDVVLSNSYFAGFDRVISDFTDEIYEAYREVTKNTERIKEKESDELDKEDITDVEKDRIKQNSKKDIDAEKKEYSSELSKGKNEVKDDFRGYLRTKIK